MLQTITINISMYTAKWAISYIDIATLEHPRDLAIISCLQSTIIVYLKYGFIQ